MHFSCGTQSDSFALAAGMHTCHSILVGAPMLYFTWIERLRVFILLPKDLNKEQLWNSLSEVVARAPVFFLVYTALYADVHRMDGGW